MFEVNKNSWHYRWLALLFKLENRELYAEWLENKKKGYSWLTNDFYIDEGYPPGDFCAYWRAVLLWPALKIAISLSTIAGIIMLLSMANLKGGLVFVVGLIGAILLISIVIGLCWLFDYIENIKPRNVISNSFFDEMYKTQKSKICPLIKYKNGSENNV
jgi:hypothetical protein